MTNNKARRDPESAQRPATAAERSSYVPGTLAGATLAGVAVVILLSYMNWQETRQTQRTLEARLGQLDERIAQISRAAPAAAPARGPDPNRVYSVKTEGAPFKGPKDAPISIVEFSDFQCPFCGKVGPTLEQIRKVYGDKVRIVWKNNPLDFHKEAPLAHLASMAANEQGKFWEYHDKLFADQQKLKADFLTGYARELGLEMKRFDEDLISPRLKLALEADMAEAKALGATGTPAFFINGRYLSGAKPFEEFAEAINAELGRLNLPVPAGAPKPAGAAGG